MKSDSRAAKVALMKMKLHALGETSTPQVCVSSSIISHVVYFQISLFGLLDLT